MGADGGSALGESCRGAVGSLSVFLWARRFKSCYPRAAANRSPNRIANRFMAAFQSKVALTDLASTLRSANHRSLMAASSVGK